jgi:hypothetical protein
MSDMPTTERRAAELAALAAVFYRKCISENMTPFISADLTKTYLQTVMLHDINKQPPEPWEK